MNKLDALDALARDLPRVCAVIGGGGKTSLVFALGEFLAAQGRRVVITTTTHMGWRPDVVSPQSPEELNGRLRPGRVVLAGRPGEAAHKMVGIPTAWYGQFGADHILVEADGSRCHPLKYHRSNEPMVPEGAGLVVQVAGLSALDRPAGEVLHCWEWSGVPADRIVDEDCVVRLLRRGFEAAEAPARKLVLLNQADTPELAARGEEITRLLGSEGIEGMVTALKEVAET